jgi:hypothetical protein
MKAYGMSTSGFLAFPEWNSDDGFAKLKQAIAATCGSIQRSW